METQIPIDVVPSLVLCYFTEEYSYTELASKLHQRFPDTPIQGASSCRGIMTEKGFHTGPVVGLLLICDNVTSAYGCSTVCYDDFNSIEEATLNTLNQAIKNSGRVGEQPDLILLHTTSGSEEAAVACINEEFCGYVPLMGGTAADNQVTGNWGIFSNHTTTRSGVSISVLYPSQSISTGFQAGYSATDISGLVTKVQGRELIEIDNQPALDVYRAWVAEFDNSELVVNGKLFESTNSFPFGRVSYGDKQQPLYNLAHPVQIGPNGGIETFTSIQLGEVIHLMTGTRQRLISRAERVVDAAKSSHLSGLSSIGGLCIFCAGSMIHIEETMNQVSQQVHYALDKKPFICPFTYGEQGGFNPRVNSHGNLMISSAVFHASKRNG